MSEPAPASSAADPRPPALARETAKATPRSTVPARPSPGTDGRAAPGAAGTRPAHRPASAPAPALAGANRTGSAHPQLPHPQRSPDLVRTVLEHMFDAVQYSASRLVRQVVIVRSSRATFVMSCVHARRARRHAADSVHSGGWPVTAAPPRLRVVEFTAMGLIDRLSDALGVYVTAMGYPRSAIRQRAPLWREHTRRPGWRGVGALDERNSLVGVCSARSRAGCTGWPTTSSSPSCTYCPARRAPDSANSCCAPCWTAATDARCCCPPRSWTRCTRPAPGGCTGGWDSSTCCANTALSETPAPLPCWAGRCRCRRRHLAGWRERRARRTANWAAPIRPTAADERRLARCRGATSARPAAAPPLRRSRARAVSAGRDGAARRLHPG